MFEINFLARLLNGGLISDEFMKSGQPGLKNINKGIEPENYFHDFKYHQVNSMFLVKMN